MSTLGAQGFPTFVLEIDGEWLAAPHSRFASSPAQFGEWLDGQLRAHSHPH
jgi:protein-disulfide isomerase-like protein with CxxC motif